MKINIIKLIVGLNWSLVQADPSLLWPKPSSYQLGTQTIIIPNELKFIYDKTSTRLQRGIDRYRHKLNRQRWSPIVPTFKSHSKQDTTINFIIIQVDSYNEDLNLETDESYELGIDPKEISIYLKAKTIYGALHGLESLIQMAQYDKDHGKLILNRVPFNIKDSPKFNHRGLLLDTSRNFYPMEDIKRTIDAMSMNKMNVFHWHIVDSHSWPFKSEKHPLLWQRGTAFPDQVYSFKDIREIIDFGLDRGVRVIPELEAPAHSYAIGKAYPDIATCMDEDDWSTYAAEPPSGQIDPINPKSIGVVKDIMDEFIDVFPDPYLHLSGDEVNLECWKKDKNISDYLRSHNVAVETLLPTFAKQMHHHAQDKQRKVMVWQEMILNHKVTLPKDSLIQVWTGLDSIKKVVEQGYRAIASNYEYWYLDCGRGTWLGNTPTSNSWCDPFKHWQRMYSYDPLANLTGHHRDNVLGGEVAIWSEQVDPINLDIVTWPRTSAAAEVLWSGPPTNPNNLTTVIPRFNNFRYYLVANGIRADAVQPLWCILHPGRCELPPQSDHLTSSAHSHHHPTTPLTLILTLTLLILSL